MNSERGLRGLSLCLSPHLSCSYQTSVALWLDVLTLAIKPYETMLGQEAHVIFYANKVRDSTQMNYSTMEKEFLAMLFTFLSFIPTIAPILTLPRLSETILIPVPFKKLNGAGRVWEFFIPAPPLLTFFFKKLLLNFLITLK